MPTTKRIRVGADEPVDLSAIDWAKVRATTDADIDRQIAEDPDTAPEWKQGRRRPEGPARLLLKLIEREPEFVQRVLSEEGPG